MTAATIRLASGIVAVAAWTGLALQFDSTFALAKTVPLTLFVLLRYLTIITNLWAAVQFTGLAAGASRFGSPRAMAGLTMAMLLVGIVYALLLNGFLNPHGVGLVADVVMHKVTPALVTLFWLGFTPKGRVRRHDPLIWVLLPLIYLIYALARAWAGDVYPYPFLDVGKLGPGRVTVTVLVIGLVYIAGGYLFAWLDRWLARRGTGSGEGP